MKYFVMLLAMLFFITKTAFATSWWEDSTVLSSPLTGIYINQFDETNVLFIEEVGPAGIFEYHIVQDGAVSKGITAYSVGGAPEMCIYIRKDRKNLLICPSEEGIRSEEGTIFRREQ